MRVVVTLNGTDKNPYTKMGLTQNPFPRIPKAEFATVNALLAKLDADPIRDEAHLRELLIGCAPEFVEGCVQRFKKGERTEFVVEWPS